MNQKDKKPKVVYLSGPIDATHVHECWLKGEEDEEYFGTHYLLQFYQVCHDLELETHVISLLQGENLQHDEGFIEYCPVPLLETRGIVYHIGQLFYFSKFIAKVIGLRADIVLIVPGRQYWFLLSVLPIFGIKVIPSLHCVLWPKFKTISKVQNFLLKLTKIFFINSCSAILAISEDVIEQVKTLTKGKNRPVFTFLPTYRREQFQSIPNLATNETVFSVLFAGRIEANKGIYTILNIARNFQQRHIHNIVFEICGIGSQLSHFKEVVSQEELDEMFIFHGFCSKPELKKLYQQSDVVIVPTTKDFIEGFNKVLAESVLNAKPAITSAVCPAVSVVKDAVIEVPPEDVEAYATAILALHEDKDLYERKRLACLELQEKFYDESNSWGHQFRHVLLKYVL